MLRRRRRDSPTPAENVCSYEKLAEVVEALNATMEKTETGTVLTDYVDYLQHMGTDAWVDCISIVRTQWKARGRRRRRKPRCARRRPL